MELVIIYLKRTVRYMRRKCVCVKVTVNTLWMLLNWLLRWWDSPAKAPGRYVAPVTDDDTYNRAWRAKSWLKLSSASNTPHQHNRVSKCWCSSMSCFLDGHDMIRQIISVQPRRRIRLNKTLHGLNISTHRREAKRLWCEYHCNMRNLQITKSFAIYSKFGDFRLFR